MQGKKDMIDDILQSAKKTSAAMIEETTAELNGAAEVLRAELDDAKKRSEESAKAAADAFYSGRVKLGELEAGKILLDAKSRCVDAVYAAVRDKILKMPDKDYLALMQKLVGQNASDGDEIVVGASEKRITAEWVKKASKALGKKLALSKDKGDFECGLVLRNDKFDIDLTVDAIVADLRERTVEETTKKLGL